MVTEFSASGKQGLSKVTEFSAGGKLSYHREFSGRAYLLVLSTRKPILETSINSITKGEVVNFLGQLFARFWCQVDGYSFVWI